MQDGSRGTSRGFYICTDGFTYMDVVRLGGYLKTQYGLNISIHKANKKFCPCPDGSKLTRGIYILANAVEKLKNLILPYMVPTMLYKLGI